MTLVVSANASVFLVVTGDARSDSLTPPSGPSLFKHGVTFRFASPHGAIDLAIATPSDLAGFADLSAAAILKPVCLPIAMSRLHHGIVHARLHNDPVAHALAQRFLTAITTTLHPARQRRCSHVCCLACSQPITKEE